MAVACPNSSPGAKPPQGEVYGCDRAGRQEVDLPFPPGEGAYPRASVFAVSLERSKMRSCLPFSPA